jgi:uncharacterized delta-60 repeat protein
MSPGRRSLQCAAIKPQGVIVRIDLISAAMGLALASQAHAQCTAGQVDMAYGGVAASGYVQISPVLQLTTEFEGTVSDSVDSIYAATNIAVDPSGNAVASVINVKHGGARDLTFGGYGTVVPLPPSADTMDSELAMDPSGNIIVAMLSTDQSNMVLTRYLPSGAPDTSFGSNGQSTIAFPNYASGVFNLKAGPDGSLYVATGSQYPNPPFQPVIFKTTPSGALDTSFGASGFAYFYSDNYGPFGKATDLWLNADGTILVAGRVGDNQTYAQFFVARLFANGALDTSFGNNGITVVAFGSGSIAYGRKMVVTPDGKIVVTGGLVPAGGALASTAVIRLLANGALDKSFNGTGQLTLSNFVGYVIAVQNNNKILLGGNDGAAIHGQVVRLLTNGQLDTAFGSAGISTLNPPGWPTASVSHVNYLSSGKIIVHAAGGRSPTTSNAGYLVRLDSGSGIGCH